MSMKEINRNNHTTAHAISVAAGVPYSTVYKLEHDQTTFDKCSYGTVSRIAGLFNVSSDIIAADDEFSHFRDEMHHQLKRQGSKLFLAACFVNDLPNQYYRGGWTLRALYTVCLCDYLSDLVNEPKPPKYNRIRSLYYDPPVRISDRKDCNGPYIPVFEEHGILEGDVFDAV